ncbi:DUF397 domain-containing protein [Streptomyces luteireticuli]|uniref:DUF397 domain-containing protein n=1 Tax=Streptomyces luteireticuli TaxID=173858 RepID=A0ABN0YYA4_9ACTN
MKSLNRAGWRKSTYSSPGGTDCVEISDCPLSGILIRDSKNRGAAPLSVTPPAWNAFLTVIRGE